MLLVRIESFISKGLKRMRQTLNKKGRKEKNEKNAEYERRGKRKKEREERRKISVLNQTARTRDQDKL